MPKTIDDATFEAAMRKPWRVPGEVAHDGSTLVEWADMKPGHTYLIGPCGPGQYAVEQPQQAAIPSATERDCEACGNPLLPGDDAGLCVDCAAAIVRACDDASATTGPRWRTPGTRELSDFPADDYEAALASSEAIPTEPVDLDDTQRGVYSLGLWLAFGVIGAVSLVALLARYWPQIVAYGMGQ